MTQKYAFPANCINSDSGLVHNFAFGSNLSKEKMESRGISVARVRNAVLKDYVLRFSQLGFPPTEPSFANLERCPGDEVHGVVFDLEPDQFQILWHGEGKGDWYSTDIIDLVCYGDSGEAGTGEILSGVVAFVCLPKRRVPGGGELPPSRRYKSLITLGAAAAGLDQKYQAQLATIPEAPPPSGISLFLSKKRFIGNEFLSKLMGGYPEGQAPVLLRLFEELRKVWVDIGQRGGALLMRTPFPGLGMLFFVPEAGLGAAVSMLRAFR